MSELPQGWTQVAIGDVASISRRTVDPHTIDPLTPYVGLEHIESGGRLLPHPTTGDAGIKSAKVEFTKEHVLVGKLRPYLAKITTAPHSGVASTDILPLLPGDQLDRRFLLHYLRQRPVVDQLNGLATGANLPRLSPKALAGFKLPLPPLPEQRRIAAILDKTIGLKEQAQIALGKATEVEWNLFRDTFGSPQSPRGGAYVMPFGELVKVKSGSFLPAHAMDPNGIYPVFGGNGANGFHNEYMFTEARVVIGRVGAYCGAVHVTPSDAWVTDNALYVSETSVHCEPEFLALALRQANLNQHASQSGQPSISARRLANAQVLVAPVDAQHDFNRKRRAVTSNVEHHRVRTHHLSHLQDSLASRAFRGEL